MSLHVVGLVVSQVIVSQQVQKAMHDEMDEVMVECLVFGTRLSGKRLISDDDVAEMA